MEKICFNNKWLFQKNCGEKISIDLPHDAMIGEKRRPDCESGFGGAYFPGGIYTYEKIFTVPDDWIGKTIILQCEGAYRKAAFYVNGCEAGGKPYGYIPFFVDITPHLDIGGENIVCIKVDNSQIPNSRWYTGSGIYRPVWLYLGGINYIKPEGVRITTVSYEPALIKVEVEHIGEGKIDIEILDNFGRVVAYGESSVSEILIRDAKLWSDENPNLYQCKVRLVVNGSIADEAMETFGIRKIEWGGKGLFINGNETLLRGGCVHHDNGILGARCYAESEERRVRILKQAGFNAIRSAHNPISKAILNACDRYGIYVMDELWDMWYKPKTKHDYALDFEAHYQYDMEAMTSRDYNHPSVIMYSIGNEVSEPHDEKGLSLTKKLVEAMHGYDNTRPITCGLNLMILYTTIQGKAVSAADLDSGKETAFNMPPPTDSISFNQMAAMMGTGMNRASAMPEVDKAVSPVLDMLDIAGYNYSSGRYPIDGTLHPGRIIVGSETYPQDIAKNWEMVKKYPYLIGDFMWTAWDYLGEVGLGAWAYTKDGMTFEKPYPWLLADTGAIDILGNIGAEAEYAGVVWGIRKTPYIGVQAVNHNNEEIYKATWRGTNAIASWAWHGCDGNPAAVEVYADAATIALFIDNEQVGKEESSDFKAIFTITYKPGVLMAIAYDKNDTELSRHSLEKPEGALGIRIIPEQESAKPGEIVYVQVVLAYENGVVESNRDSLITVTATGGELLAFGSANPRTEKNYLDGAFTTYYGRALAVVRCGEKKGDVIVNAESAGYQPANVVIKIE